MKALSLLEPWACLMALRAKLAERDPFARYLDGHVWHLGCVICTLNLDKIQRIDFFTELPPDPEFSFGDYSAGRFIWHTSGVKLLDKPVPAVGKLNLWEWEPPQ